MMEREGSIIKQGWGWLDTRTGIADYLIFLDPTWNPSVKRRILVDQHFAQVSQFSYTGKPLKVLGLGAQAETNLEIEKIG